MTGKICDCGEMCFKFEDKRLFSYFKIYCVPDEKCSKGNKKKTKSSVKQSRAKLRKTVDERLGGTKGEK